MWHESKSWVVLREKMILLCRYASYTAMLKSLFFWDSLISDKFRRTKFFVDRQHFRRTKFSTLTRNFDVLSAEKFLFVSCSSMSLICSDVAGYILNFSRQNISEDKILGIVWDFRHFCAPKFYPTRYHSNPILQVTIFGGTNPSIYLHKCQNFNFMCGVKAMKPGAIFVLWAPR